MACGLDQPSSAAAVTKAKETYAAVKACFPNAKPGSEGGGGFAPYSVLM